MKGLVESCVGRFGSMQGKKVLDIGCNDGSLLDFFREQGAITIGLEPTGACADAAEKNEIEIHDEGGDDDDDDDDDDGDDDDDDDDDNDVDDDSRCRQGRLGVSCAMFCHG